MHRLYARLPAEMVHGLQEPRHLAPHAPRLLPIGQLASAQTAGRRYTKSTHRECDVMYM